MVSLNLDEARRNTIDVDPVWSQLDSHLSRQHVQPPFGCSIGPKERQGTQSMYGPDVYDFAALSLHHLMRGSLCAEKGSPEVGVKGLVP